MLFNVHWMSRVNFNKWKTGLLVKNIIILMKKIRIRNHTWKNLTKSMQHFHPEAFNLIWETEEMMAIYPSFVMITLNYVIRVYSFIKNILHVFNYCLFTLNNSEKVFINDPFVSAGLFFFLCYCLFSGSFQFHA